jgi:hypothetical protein
MSRANMPAAPRYASSVAASRQHINVDLDAEVASILRWHAAEAHVSEGEVVDRAIRAYDLRSLLPVFAHAAISTKTPRWRWYARSCTPLAERDAA